MKTFIDPKMWIARSLPLATSEAGL